LPVHRFPRPAANPSNDQPYQEIRNDQSGEVPIGVPAPSAVVSGAQFPPDLARVVATWDRLPAAIKAAILALLQAAGGPNG
jgi:hypothetical protein